MCGVDCCVFEVRGTAAVEPHGEPHTDSHVVTSLPDIDDNRDRVNKWSCGGHATLLYTVAT